MPITITATFECANIDEFNECMAIVRDNEPSTISFAGSYTFIPPTDDQTPAHGIERSEAFAKAAEAAQRAERELVTARLYNELVSVAHDYRENNQSQDDFLHDVDYLAVVVDDPQAMPVAPMPTRTLSCMRDLSYHISDDKEFCAVVHELGRDAWGSTSVQS